MIRAYGVIFLLPALTGWIIYQLVVRKKKLAAIKNEIFFTLLLIGIWTAIYYRAMH